MLITYLNKIFPAPFIFPLHIDRGIIVPWIITTSPWTG